MTEMLVRPAQRYGAPQRVSLSSEDVLDADYRPLVQSVPSWLGPVAQRIFDFYNAGSVRGPSAVALLESLNQSMWSDVPSPFVSQTEDRGVSAEFDDNDLHLHLQSDPQGRLSVYVLDGAQWDWEGPLDDLPDGISKWAWRLGITNRDHA